MSCVQKKIEHRFVKMPNKAKLAFTHKEIQCPVCESILTMDRDSQKRLKLFFIIGLVFLPFSVVMLVEQIQMLNIFDGLQRAIGILIVVAILVYLFYTILSIRYVPKKESGP